MTDDIEVWNRFRDKYPRIGQMIAWTTPASTDPHRPGGESVYREKFGHPEIYHPDCLWRPSHND